MDITKMTVGKIRQLAKERGTLNIVDAAVTGTNETGKNLVGPKRWSVYVNECKEAIAAGDNQLLVGLISEMEREIIKKAISKP